MEQNQTTTLDIEELIPDRKNFNAGTEAGAKLMRKSFEQFGAGRSVLLDKDNNIIAGNKSQKAAMEAGIKRVRIIETDGTELIAVRRTDVTLDSREGRELALADNATQQVNLAWDADVLQDVSQELGIDIQDWAVQLPDMTFEGASEQKINDNKEIDCSGLTDNVKLTFDLTSEQHDFVMQQLRTFDEDKNQGLLKALGYEE